MTDAREMKTDEITKKLYFRKVKFMTIEELCNENRERKVPGMDLYPIKVMFHRCYDCVNYNHFDFSIKNYCRGGTYTRGVLNE